MTPNVWVCGPRIYKYKDWLFEYNSNLGAWPLRKDFEPRKRAGAVFWSLLDEFLKLPEEEQKQHRIDGGCVRF